MASEACKSCLLVGETITSTVPFFEIEIGKYKELQQNAKKCPHCREIISHDTRTQPKPLEPDTPIYLYNETYPDSDFQIAAEGHDSIYLEITPLFRPKSDQSVGIRLNKNWIDIQRLKTWITFCDATHHCNPAKSSVGKQIIRPAEEILLVDVGKGCIVNARGTVKYFALSYVWEKDAGALETTMANIKTHQEKGYFSQGEGCDLLPKTIQDAMRLVNSLDEQYLWVDRLCIIQDDPHHKQAQIEQMGSIYAHSYCTIIAADGKDSNHGLRGVGAGSAARYCDQKIVDFPGAPCVVMQELGISENRSLWSTRGWTFQEAIMSPRMLVFADDCVAWRCQRRIWREDMTGDPEGAIRPEHRDASNKFTRYLWPNLYQWINFVMKYNRRDLTFESDRLAAFTGVESVLSQSFPGGFNYGLPEFFFDIAMLWQPISPIKRRLGGHIDSSSDHYLPSWSWVGWHGTLDPKSLYSGMDYWRETQQTTLPFTTCQTSPLVEWHIVDLHGREHKKIKNDYHLWRHKFQNSDSGELPAGWKRHVDGEINNMTWYNHPNAPREEFWWPLPIGSDFAEYSTRSLLPYLSFTAARAYFKIKDSILCSDLQSCMSVSICDMDGKWAGVSRLNIRKSDPVPHELLCETVAISKGKADNSADEGHFLDEWNVEQRPKFGSTYEYYNVLYVVREEHWVVRKGLGRVEKAAWQRQNLEEVNLRLR